MVSVRPAWAPTQHISGQSGKNSESLSAKRGGGTAAISPGFRARKEISNILGHQRNENQNNSEIPSYTRQNG